MRIFLLLLLTVLAFSSCQKQIKDLLPIAATDSTTTVIAQKGQLIGIKVFGIVGADTLPSGYIEYKFDSVSNRLIIYNHMGIYNTHQFDLNRDTADKFFTYDRNNLLISQSGFHNGLNNITYTSTVGRKADGSLASYSYTDTYVSLDCTTLQNTTKRHNTKGTFEYQVKDGFKTIHYLDTATVGDSFGNQNADYTVYFNADGTIKMKILNGIIVPGDNNACGKFKYITVNDTVKQFFYAGGKLQKSIIKYNYPTTQSTSPRSSLTYVLNYTYAPVDNGKIARFCTQYPWGKDLSGWFSYQPQTIGELGGGSDFYFSEDYDHLKYGICTKISGTWEYVNGGVSQGIYPYESSYKNEYDADGNLVRCSTIPGANQYLEFIYSK